MREQRSVADLALVPPRDFKAKRDAALPQSRFEQHDLFRLVGLSRPCSLAATQEISAQWQQFMSFYAAIAAKCDPVPWGVMRAAPAAPL